ncbi:HAD family phosphatase [Kosakonia sp. MUSA4]|uniref:HAD family hydrolase n=1 Tax=Kosakonia sp. MUSA4 TaxID=2067958 RepID=UPI0015988FB0|nr:HAD-IA family hydrolase [Kosakonia sp. MUSA4]QJT80546.1 hypothetical protein C0557_10880 [Kosakonia sp. MUSA4]
MKFGLLICDCDGVLVDSELLACMADAEELADRGFPEYDLDVILKRFAGVKMADMVAIIENETGRAVGEDYDAIVSARVMGAIHLHLKALPMAKEILSVLEITKCVASSSAPEKLSLSLNITRLEEIFAPHIYSTELVENGKPAPDIFLYAAEKHNVRPEQCCVIEDSVPGVIAARAAGMQVIGFTGGGHCGEGHAARLHDHGAATVVHHWSEVPQAIERLSLEKA